MPFMSSRSKARCESSLLTVPNGMVTPSVSTLPNSSYRCWLNTPVTAAVVDPRGTLTVAFGNADLVVPYDEMYEAWQMRSDDGLLIVSRPGGDLAIWRPESDGPDPR